MMHPSVLPAISGLNGVDKRQAVGIVETGRGGTALAPQTGR